MAAVAQTPRKEKLHRSLASLEMEYANRLQNANDRVNYTQFVCDGVKADLKELQKHFRLRNIIHIYIYKH